MNKMAETDLLKLLSDKQITKEGVDNIGALLNEVDKYSSLIDKVGSILTKLDKSGVLPAILRVVGAKTGADLDKPLPQSSLSVESRSPSHALLFKKLNELPDSQIENMLTEGIRQQLKAEEKKGKGGK
jgi:uncharacterized protein YjgD (DUF1641 family)